MTTMHELFEEYEAVCDRFGLSTFVVEEDDPNDLWETLADTIEQTEALVKLAVEREEPDVAEGLVAAIEALTELQDLALDQPYGSDSGGEDVSHDVDDASTDEAEREDFSFRTKAAC